MAKNDLRKFAQDIRIKASYVTKNSDALTREVALAVVKELVPATPVKTGRARSNWRTLLYKPNSILYWPPNDIPGEGKPESPEAGAQRSLDEAQETVGVYTGGRRSIWIINNVPYLPALNAGASPQALPGFVEAAVIRAREKVRKAQPLLSKPVTAVVE